MQDLWMRKKPRILLKVLRCEFPKNIDRKGFVVKFTPEKRPISMFNFCDFRCVFCCYVRNPRTSRSSILNLQRRKARFPLKYQTLTGLPGQQ